MNKLIAIGEMQDLPNRDTRFIEIQVWSALGQLDARLHVFLRDVAGDGVDFFGRIFDMQKFQDRNRLFGINTEILAFWIMPFCGCRP